MDFDVQRQDFDQNLVLGLKHGLIIANDEIAKLVRQLHESILKRVEAVDENRSLRADFGLKAQEMRSQIETLTKDLKHEIDKNLNVNFQFNQLRALADDRLREIDQLKAENMKITKTTQKKEQTSKSSIQTRTLKAILRKRRNTPDSEILAKISDLVYGNSKPDLDACVAEPAPVSDVAEPTPISIVLEHDSVPSSLGSPYHLKIEIMPHLISPALPEASSIPLTPEKAPAANTTDMPTLMSESPSTAPESDLRNDVETKHDTVAEAAPDSISFSDMITIEERADEQLDRNSLFDPILEETKPSSIDCDIENETIVNVSVNEPKRVVSIAQPKASLPNLGETSPETLDRNTIECDLISNEPERVVSIVEPETPLPDLGETSPETLDLNAVECDLSSDDESCRPERVVSIFEPENLLPVLSETSPETQHRDTIECDPSSKVDSCESGRVVNIVDPETPLPILSEASPETQHRDTIECDPSSEVESCESERVVSIVEPETPLSILSEANPVTQHRDTIECDPSSKVESCEPEHVASIFEPETPLPFFTETDPETQTIECDPILNGESCKPECVVSVVERETPILVHEKNKTIECHQRSNDESTAANRNSLKPEAADAATNEEHTLVLDSVTKAADNFENKNAATNEEHNSLLDSVLLEHSSYEASSDEGIFEYDVEKFLLEIRRPLKPVHEIESLFRFFEMGLDVPRKFDARKPSKSNAKTKMNQKHEIKSLLKPVKMDLDMPKKFDDQKLSKSNKKTNQEHEIKSLEMDLDVPRKFDARKPSKSNAKTKISETIRARCSKSQRIKDVHPLLEKISNWFSNWLINHDQLEEFARKLNSESCDVVQKEDTDSSYVVLLETTDSGCSSGSHSPDIRDEILNEWIAMDSLNEIDLDTVESDPQNSDPEYTTTLSPSSDQVLHLEDTVQKIHVEKSDRRSGNVVCWMDKVTPSQFNLHECYVSKHMTIISPAPSSDEVPRLECTVPAIDVETKDELPDDLSDGFRGWSDEEIKPKRRVLAELIQEARFVMTKEEDSECGSEEPADLVIDEETEIEPKIENPGLAVPEYVSEIVKFFDYKEAPFKNLTNKECFEGSSTTVVDAHVGIGLPIPDHSRTTRYNLRNKSTRDYAALASCRTRKRNLCQSSSPTARKLPKLDLNAAASPPPSLDEPQSVSPALDTKNVDDETVEKPVCVPKFYVEKSCVPNFYVENEKTSSDSTQRPTPSHFEIVWSTIRNMSIHKPQTSSWTQDSTLVPCNEKGILKTAFTFRGRNVQKPYFCERKNLTPKQKIRMDLAKRHIKVYLRSIKEPHQLSTAITNLLADVRLESPAIICYALETVLLNIELPNIHDCLTFICMNIDEKLFPGFVNEMKQHLKESMNTKVFVVENGSNCPNLISSIILQSGLYTALCQATGVKEDVMNLLCESLMTQKNRAHPIAYGVLKRWPKVLHEITSCQPSKKQYVDVILFCLVHHRMGYNSELYKVKMVQDMVYENYGVRLGDKTAEEHVRDTLMNISNENWMDAIALLCKRQMFSWTYLNVIIKYFVPILRTWKTENVDEALLLGIVRALRQVLMACPYTKENPCSFDFKCLVQTLSDILHAKILSSRELKETAYLVICELSTRDFQLCFRFLSEWTPSDGMASTDTLGQLKALMVRKSNYENWVHLMPLRARVRVPPQKRKKCGNQNASEDGQENVIAVGVTLSSQALRTRPPNVSSGNVKKKKKNKSKNRNRNKKH